MTHYPKFFLNKGGYLMCRSCITQPKKQFKVQIIDILEEKDSFYWLKMDLWKGAKKLGGPSPPPHLEKIQKNSSFSSGARPIWLPTSWSPMLIFQEYKLYWSKQLILKATNALKNALNVKEHKWVENPRVLFWNLTISTPSIGIELFQIYKIFGHVLTFNLQNKII